MGLTAIVMGVPSSEVCWEIAGGLKERIAGSILLSTEFLFDLRRFGGPFTIRGGDELVMITWSTANLGYGLGIGATWLIIWGSSAKPQGTVSQ